MHVLVSLQLIETTLHSQVDNDILVSALFVAQSMWFAPIVCGVAL